MAKAAGSIWIEGTELHFVSSVQEEYFHVGEVVPGIISKSYQQVILEDNPSHYWRLNETSGLVAVDMVGGKNGTISGGVTLNQPGKHDKAMLFDGVDGRITVPNIPFPGSFSWEAWIRADVIVEPLTWRYFICASYSDWYFGFIAYQRDIGTWRVDAISTDETSWAWAESPSPVTIGVLHHFVFVFDKVNNLIRIYLDNVAGVANEIPAGASFEPPPETLFLIGDVSENATGDLNWNGLIDEVAVYPYALSPSQIANHFNAPLAANARGSIWIEGDYLHYVDAANQERRILSELVAAQAGISGSLWSEISRLHWLNESGAEERRGHNDVAHVDGHNDVAHSDAVHTDVPAVSTHTDSHSDSAHKDVPHTDTHTDTHSDTHGDVSHNDSHTDVAHADTHGDVAHSDVAHADGGGHGDHQDVGHADSGGHGDIPHSDTAHTDTHSDTAHSDVAHSDRAHSDSHSDTHSDVAHKDTAHQDNAHSDSHSDVAHQDIAHGDAAHGDIEHSDGHLDTIHDDQPTYVGP